MTDARRTKIIETVKKLIAHQISAEAIGSEDEARAFASKVTLLMRQYRIERGELLGERAPGYGTTLIAAFPATPGVAPWQAFLYQVIAEANACQSIVIKDNGQFFIAGQHVDRHVVVALSGQLVRSVERQLVDTWTDASVPAAEHNVRYADFATSFRMGFIEALRDRLMDDEAEADEREGSQAVILVGKAVMKTAQFVERITRGSYSDETTMTEIKDDNGFDAGYAAGEAADLNANTLEPPIDVERERWIAEGIEHELRGKVTS